MPGLTLGFLPRLNNSSHILFDMMFFTRFFNPVNRDVPACHRLERVLI